MKDRDRSGDCVCVRVVAFLADFVLHVTFIWMYVLAVELFVSKIYIYKCLLRCYIY